jgi:hypothetical protein
MECYSIRLYIMAHCATLNTECNTGRVIKHTVQNGTDTVQHSTAQHSGAHKEAGYTTLHKAAQHAVQHSTAHSSLRHSTYLDTMHCLPPLYKDDIWRNFSHT